MSEYIAKLSMLALTVTLAWMLARWTWIFAAPRTDIRSAAEGAAVPDIAAARETIITSGLFASGTLLKNGAATAPTTLNLKLAGIFQSRSGRDPSLAVLSLNGKPNEVVGEGREIASGVVLARIAKDHVLIRRQGLLERVEFPQSAGNPGGAFNLDVQRQGQGQYSFSRNTLNRALQDPAQIAQLGALSVTPGTGITIDQAPNGSLAQKLNLQPGDVLKLVNGESVATNEDLLRLYQKFTSTGQVTLEGLRKGAPFKQTYSVTP